MMSCLEAQELISRLLDEDLSAEEQRELERHIASCPDCKATYDAFSSLSRAIREDLEEPPAALRETVMAKLRRDAIRRRQPPKRVRSFLALAACAALVILAATNLPRMGASAPMLAASKEPQEAALTESAAAAVTEEDVSADSALFAARTDTALGAAPAAAPPADAPAEAPMPAPEAALGAESNAQETENFPAESEPARATVWPFVLLGIPLLGAAALLLLRGKRRG